MPTFLMPLESGYKDRECYSENRTCATTLPAHGGEECDKAAANQAHFRREIAKSERNPLLYPPVGKSPQCVPGSKPEFVPTHPSGRCRPPGRQPGLPHREHWPPE